MRLTEASYFEGYEILEGSGEGAKPLIVRGVFGRANVKNENGRIYPDSVWRKVLSESSEAMGRIKSRNFFSELDHPDDGRTLLQRVAGLTTRLEMRPDGAVYGEAEILPTPAGKILEALFRSKAKIGISSRGEGDLLKTESGDIVQENFELQAFDFVHNPSTQGAYPNPVFEHLLARRTGDRMMDLMEEFKALEKSVLELVNLKPAEVSAAMRPLVERQATETMVKLSKLSESAGDMKPLFTGLLSELNTARRPFVRLGENDGGNYHPGLVDKLLAATNTAKAGEAGSVEALPAKVEPDSLPLIPGADPKAVGESKTETKRKEEAKMAEAAKKNSMSKALRSAIREAEDELDQIATDESEDETALAAQEAAQKCESRLLKAARKVMEGDGANLMPDSYEPAEPKGEEEIGESEDGDEDDVPTLTASDDDENQFGEDENGPPPEIQAKIDAKESKRRRPSALRRFSESDDDSIDIPAPPKEEAETEPTDDDGQPLPPMEAKIVKTYRKLVRENRRMRYEAKVTEAIAAKAIAKLTRRVRATEAARPSAPAFIVAGGQKIPVKVAGSVIESLVRRYKELKKTFGGKVTESAGSPDPGSISEGPFGVPSFAKVGNVARLNEAATAGRKTEKSILESQAELGARVAARIGRV